MQKRFGVVFVSRRNSLRSVLAQACLAHLDPRRFQACSCGRPGEIAEGFHSAALGALHGAGIAPPSRPPRDWNDLVRMGAPSLDFVVTLDDSVAPHQPRWPGQPDTALWSFPDVLAIDEGADATAHAAIQMLCSLRRRLELLISLPLAGIDRAAVRSDLRDLAHLR